VCTWFSYICISSHYNNIITNLWYIYHISFSTSYNDNIIILLLNYIYIIYYIIIIIITIILLLLLWGQGQGWWHMSCGGIACG